MNPIHQLFGACKCGGNYRFETLGGYGMDAFKVTFVQCLKCGFKVTWQDDPNGSAPDAWERARRMSNAPDQRVNTTQLQSPGSTASGCSEKYVAAKCLREEVQRFKSTNRFTPMEVTGFYIQAAVVLDEHDAMQNMLKAAVHALRSYQYGNASPDLAESIAEKIERTLPLNHL